MKRDDIYLGIYFTFIIILLPILCFLYALCAVYDLIYIYTYYDKTDKKSKGDQKEYDQKTKSTDQ